MAARAILVAAVVPASASPYAAVGAVASAVAVPEAGASRATAESAASPASARGGDPAAGVRLQAGGGGRHVVERIGTAGSSGLLPLLMLGRAQDL